MHTDTKAPAKVNLSLLVGPRDSRGYHELFSVFVPIGLFDSLSFDLVARPAGAGPVSARLEIDCAVAPNEDNLVAWALRALGKVTGWRIEGRVSIEKGIPTGAGLGGGSSDAAAALRAGAQAIAAAGGLEPGDEILRSVARGVGADVPFFLDPRPSMARGIGDVLEPLDLPALPLVLVFNQAGLSTATVYREFDRMAANQAHSPVAEHAESGFAQRAYAEEVRWRTLGHTWRCNRSRPGRPEDHALRFRGSEVGQLVAAIAALVRNDLEKAAFGLLPGLAEDLRAIVGAGALQAGMTGSGPTLFGLCGSEAAADAAASRLAEQGFRACPVTAA